MKKHTLCISIILFVGLGVSAQTNDKTVETISKRYTDVAEKARLAETDEERGQFDELFMNELTINKLNHQWRAVGIHKLTYKFFYKGGDTEERMYPDQLILVKVERQQSNRTYWEEYLYSETGVLMFYYQKAENDDQAPVERRVYFSGIKAIRVVDDAKSRDRLTAKDAEIFKESTLESIKIKDIFLKSIKL